MFLCKKLVMAMAAALAFGATGGEVTATAVTAQQRYPWNGMVDVAVTLSGASNEVARAQCGNRRAQGKMPEDVA